MLKYKEIEDRSDVKELKTIFKNTGATSVNVRYKDGTITPDVNVRIYSQDIGESGSPKIGPDGNASFETLGYRFTIGKTQCYAEFETHYIDIDPEAKEYHLRDVIELIDVLEKNSKYWHIRESPAKSTDKKADIQSNEDDPGN